MHAADQAKLTQAVTAVNNLRTSGTGIGLSVGRVDITFPDGRVTTLLWDTEANDWIVSAPGLPPNAVNNP